MLEADNHQVEDFATEDLDAFIAYHHDAIRRIARSKARRMGFTTADDIEQAVVEHVITKWTYYSGKPASEVEPLLVKTAGRFVSKESDDYMYFTGGYIYNPAEVRRHLRESAWSEGDNCPDVDAKVDLRAAFKTLTKGRQEAVYQHFALGVPSSEMPDSVRKSKDRGVDDITNWLNRREGVRSVSMDELRAKVFSPLPATGLSGRRMEA